MQPLEDVPLAPLCTLGVGGPASFLVEANREASVLAALEWADRYGVGVRVLGGGSNVVVSDAGFDGLVIRIALSGVEWREESDGSTVLHAAAGETWDGLVARSVERNLAGIECLSGIPGRAGATPIQNVGAYGQEVAETISAVRAFDRHTKRVVTLSPAECRFGYRDSLFKSEEPERFVVLGIDYRLVPGGAPTVRYPELARRLESAGTEYPSLSDVRRTVLEVRREKSMVLDPADENARSCGSFFVNPLVTDEQLAAVEAATGDAGMPRYPQPDGRTKLSAAWLIQHAGFSRGERAGPVGLSTRHTLALVCHEGARAGDVVAFARRIRACVQQRFGVRLVPEPVFWGFASLDAGLPDERLT